jgi:hypothetical protein
MAATIIGGTLLRQAALHAGPLSVLQLVLVITDRLAQHHLEHLVFGERCTGSPAKITSLCSASP